MLAKFYSVGKLCCTFINTRWKTLVNIVENIIYVCSSVVLSYLGWQKKASQTGWVKHKFVSQSGGSKSEIKVLAGLVPFEGCQGGSIPGLAPSYCWYAGCLCCSLACELNLCLHFHMAFSLCVCLCPHFFFFKDTSHTALGVSLTSVIPHLT